MPCCGEPASTTKRTLKPARLGSPGILVEATLTQALDLSLAHPGLNEGRIKAKTFSDNSSIDAKRAINKRDPGHR
jgi:hypothetical protein